MCVKSELDNEDEENRGDRVRESCMKQDGGDSVINLEKRIFQSSQKVTLHIVSRSGSNMTR